jgi:hypothetical protein
VEEGDVNEDELRAAAPEEDDHDLLTYDEVAIRLRLEIDRARQRLESAAPEAKAAAAARLETLIEASKRNGRRQVNDDNVERFFGFPSPRRSPSPS